MTAIDSVGFSQPTPIYKDNVRELSGIFLDYIISIDGLTIKLRSDIPDNLLPSVGNKLVQLYYTEMCPNGFLGIVTNVHKDVNSYTFTCDYINIEDAVSRFYGVYKVSSESQSSQNATRGITKASSIELFHKTFEPENIPFYMTLESLTDLWKSKNEIDGVILGGKDDISLNLQPKFDVKVTFSMDDFLNIVPKYRRSSILPWMTTL